jgi:hypothetical protein
MFFFEKKNQKTSPGRFAHIAPRRLSKLQGEKFFGSFFQKRTAFLLLVGSALLCLTSRREDHSRSERRRDARPGARRAGVGE